MRRHYEKRFIQFNDLVFDAVEMISNPATDIASFKINDTAYGFGHGSYAPAKSEWMFANAGTVSMTITLKMKKLPCDKRPFYRRFAVAQLAKIGKLWAVQDDGIVWAYARARNVVENLEARVGTVEFDVDFYLPEGIWHKASKQRTFLVPWDICDFMDCYHFKDVNPCINNGCCHCAHVKDAYCDCCDCNDLTKDMALCYHMDEIQAFYECIGPGYRVVFDCNAAQRFFGDFYGEGLGQRICSEPDSGVIAGIFYADTDIPTTGVKITLHGHVVNPYIEINGNGNTIVGEYDGVLTVYENGEVMFNTEGCPGCEPLPVSVWQVPKGMDYGWTVVPGDNRLVVETNQCCGTTCAYIEIDSYTI